MTYSSNIATYPVSTIVALATPAGEGGIGIVRLSGPNALRIASQIVRPRTYSTLAQAPSRRLLYAKVVDPETLQDIDEVLAVWMRPPTTYTGEEVVEIQGHGGMQLLNETIALLRRYGAVAAEPGEFTKRAFLNGRLDLTQAEAVMDLIQARSTAATRQAMSQLEGHLGQKIRSLTAGLLSQVASLEAWIDFSDDVDPLDFRAIDGYITSHIAQLDTLLSSAEQARVIRRGVAAAIIGSPNVGKSSLLNALLGEERAIVSEYAGTTRDIIEEQLHIDGLALTLSDTAGMHQSSDPIELLGMERSRKALLAADMLLMVLDGSRPLSMEEKELLSTLHSQPLIVVVNKCDLPLAVPDNLRDLLSADASCIYLSAASGEGLALLRAELSNRLSCWSKLPEDASLTRQRHIDAVISAREHLLQARATIAAELPCDCIAIDLRAAWACLAELIGEASSADIVEAIFRDFCIGK